MITFKEYDERLIRNTSRRLNIPSGIIKLLSNRGLHEDEQILDYLLKEYKFSNPYYLPGVKNAVERIQRALDNEEKIIICGDYDVDGMLATSMLYNYFESINANIDLHLPDREKDGYGLSVSQIEMLHSEKGAQLLISVDNGITAFDPARRASELGIDFIITDHHEPPSEGLPIAHAIINPKLLKNDPLKLSNLCGGGVAFFLVRALDNKLFPPKKNEDEKSKQKKKDRRVNSLVLAMIATIADMVPLVNDNRIIVDMGVRLLFETNLYGFNSLLDHLKFYNYPSSSDLSFKLSPILNAAGRLGKSEKTLELLTSNDLRSSTLVQDLININNQRKQMTEEQSSLAFELADKEIALGRKILVLAHKDFHMGLIGLIANKVVEKYKRPAVVISVGEESCKASARSIDGVSIKEVAIDKMEGFHLGGGGHNAAAGFSLSIDQVAPYVEKIQEFADFDVDNINFNLELEISFEMADLEEKEIPHYLYLMEPFGMENAIPLVEVNNIPRFQKMNIYKGGHLRMMLTPKIELLYFFMSKEQILEIKRIESLDLPFKVYGEITSPDGERIQINAKKIEALAP